MKHDVSRVSPHAPCAATLSFDEAQGILGSQAAPRGTESVPLAKAGSRVLAEPVRAALDAPRYDAAAMDGFAVRDVDVREGMRVLPVVGATYPGAPWPGVVRRGEACRIMTGARLPPGTDRVLMREAVVQREAEIELGGRLPAKLHVRKRGSDIDAGAVVLPAGRMLDPRSLVVAAAADVAHLAVFRRPKVHCIAIGDELAVAGMAAASDEAVPDSLSEAVLLMVRQWGGKPIGSTLVRDHPAALTAVASDAVRAADVIVLIGGASRGDRDYAKSSLAPLGLELGFENVAMKPGKPVWFGRIGGCLVLGLPGNPTAAMTVARLFLAPLLTGLGGRGAEAGLRWERAPLAAAAQPSGDREAFLCAEREGDAVRIVEGQFASAQVMLARAETLVRLRPGEGALPAGSLVQSLRF